MAVNWRAPIEWWKRLRPRRKLYIALGISATAILASIVLSTSRPFWQHLRVLAQTHKPGRILGSGVSVYGHVAFSRCGLRVALSVADAPRSHNTSDAGSAHVSNSPVRRIGAADHPDERSYCERTGGKQDPLIREEGPTGSLKPTKEELDAAKAWFAAAPPEVLGNIVALLNRLEAWSMYFTKELADPDVAFGPCAPWFCSTVIQYYAVLLVVRTRGSSGKFPNTVRLFEGWLSGLEEQARGLKEGDLLNQLATLQATGAPKKTLPPPLGTSLDV